MSDPHNTAFIHLQATPRLLGPENTSIPVFQSDFCWPNIFCISPSEKAEERTGTIIGTGIETQIGKVTEGSVVLSVDCSAHALSFSGQLQRCQPKSRIVLC